MTAAELANNAAPSMFNIQYPNCTRGMFSLREPFKNMPPPITPADIEPNPEPVNEERPVEPVRVRTKSKRSAQVQCSLLTPNVHHDMAVQTKFDRQTVPVSYIYDDNIYRHKRSRPAKQHQQIYEIWDVEPAAPIDQAIRYKEIPRTRHRKPIIEYPDEEEVESDYEEERIIYARQPHKPIRKTYLPPNVRMICVRDDANRVSY